MVIILSCKMNNCTLQNNNKMKENLQKLLPTNIPNYIPTPIIKL